MVCWISLPTTRWLKQEVMKKNVINTAVLLLVILGVAALYYTGYRALDASVIANQDGTLSKIIFSEDSERQIAGTVGQGIAFVGTVLAIILAISALRTSKSQGTISAIGAFKGDFDTFVSELKGCRDKLTHLISAASEVARASYDLNQALFRAPIEDEIDSEHAWQRYQASRKLFTESVENFHACIESSSNQFLIDAIEGNLRGPAGAELQLLQDDVIRCRHEGISDFTIRVYSQSNASAWEKFKALKHMSGLGCLAGFRTEEEITETPIEDRVEEQNWVLEVKYSVLGMMGVSPRLAAPEISRLVDYLPCLPAPGVFTDGLIDVYSDDIGDSFTILDSDFHAYDYPSKQRPIIFAADKRSQALPIYARIIKIYALTLDTEAGLESIRQFLTELGGEKEIVDPLLRGYRQKIANLHNLV